MSNQSDSPTTADGASPPPDGEPGPARSRRLGRPRGPVRVPLTVRILAEHNDRLTSEVAFQGLSPQYLVEQALAEYFGRLDRQRNRTDKST